MNRLSPVIVEIASLVPLCHIKIYIMQNDLLVAENNYVLAIDAYNVYSHDISNNAMKAINNYAENIKKTIQVLEEEKERIEEHIRIHKKLLADVRPDVFGFGGSQKATETVISQGIYDESARLDAVRNAIDSLNKRVFERREILDIITAQYPHMYRDTKKGKIDFSNDFWRIIRDKSSTGQVTEHEKGGGRKATKFKIN